MECRGGRIRFSNCIDWKAHEQIRGIEGKLAADAKADSSTAETTPTSASAEEIGGSAEQQTDAFSTLRPPTIMFASLNAACVEPGGSRRNADCSSAVLAHNALEAVA